MIEFVLDREVFPRLALRPGLGYAIATFTRWVILIVGTLLALAALGIDTTKLTLVAGALSVGIGFGLQHVVNNFASGLILIVERPCQRRRPGRGRAVDRLDPAHRYSLVEPADHARGGGHRAQLGPDLEGGRQLDPLGPAAALRHRRQRRLRFAAGAGAALLVEAAGEVPEILAVPPPLAVFRGFGASSLDFRLLAWVQTIDLGLQAQNALRVAILRKLDSAGIV